MAQAKRSTRASGARARAHGAESENPPRSTDDRIESASAAGEESDTGNTAEEHLQRTPSDIGPQLGAAAAVAVATAIIEAELLPAVLIGAGATLLPRLVPGAGDVLRPMLRSAVRFGVAAFSKAQQWAAEASEEVQDVMAEIRAEEHQPHEEMMHSRAHTTRHTGAESARRPSGNA